MTNKTHSKNYGMSWSGFYFIYQVKYPDIQSYYYVRQEPFFLLKGIPMLKICANDTLIIKGFQILEACQGCCPFMAKEITFSFVGARIAEAKYIERRHIRYIVLEHPDSYWDVRQYLSEICKDLGVELQ